MMALTSKHLHISVAILCAVTVLLTGCAVEQALRAQTDPAGQGAPTISPAREQVRPGRAEIVLTDRRWSSFDEANEHRIAAVVDGGPLYANIRAPDPLGLLALPADPAGRYSFSPYPHFYLHIGEDTSLRNLTTCYITLSPQEAAGRELVVPLAPLASRPGGNPADCWLAAATSSPRGSRNYEVRLAGLASRQDWLPVADLLAVETVTVDYSGGTPRYGAMLAAAPEVDPPTAASQSAIPSTAAPRATAAVTTAATAPPTAPAATAPAATAPAATVPAATVPAATVPAASTAAATTATGGTPPAIASRSSVSTAPTATTVTPPAAPPPTAQETRTTQPMAARLVVPDPDTSPAAIPLEPSRPGPLAESIVSSPIPPADATAVPPSPQGTATVTPVPAASVSAITATPSGSSSYRPPPGFEAPAAGRERFGTGVVQASARVVIHSPAGDVAADARARALRERLLATGGFYVELRYVTLSVSSDDIRIYFEADRPRAVVTRDLLGSGSLPIRDFTDYRPLPRQGTIELWLASTRSGPNTSMSSPVPGSIGR